MFKNIIWRRPFVTKKQRRMARNCSEAAALYTKTAELALEELEREDLTKDQRADLQLLVTENVVRAANYSNKAARYLGFRNITDCGRYYDRYERCN